MQVAKVGAGEAISGGRARRVTVTAGSAVRVDASDEGYLRLLIRNVGGAQVQLGFSPAEAQASGMPLDSGETMSFQFAKPLELWAYAINADAELAVMEASI